MKNRGQDIRIVYEDRWLIVIDKPAGLLTMSTGKTGEVTAYTMLTDYLGRVFIVHRLDRETSGLLVFRRDGMKLCSKGGIMLFSKEILKTRKDGSRHGSTKIPSLSRSAATR